MGGGGLVIPPFIIFPGVQIPLSWGLENDLDDNTAFAD